MLTSTLLSSKLCFELTWQLLIAWTYVDHYTFTISFLPRVLVPAYWLKYRKTVCSSKWLRLPKMSRQIFVGHVYLYTWEEMSVQDGAYSHGKSCQCHYNAEIGNTWLHACSIVLGLGIGRPLAIRYVSQYLCQDTWYLLIPGALRNLNTSECWIACMQFTLHS